MPFAVIVTGREMRSGAPGKPIMGAEGDRYWVSEDYWGSTSSRYTDHSAVPANVKTFATKELAEAFAKAWKGHPWWCSPRGEFEIVPIEPRFKQVLVGYAVGRGTGSEPDVRIASESQRRNADESTR